MRAPFYDEAMSWIPRLAALLLAAVLVQRRLRAGRDRARAGAHGGRAARPARPDPRRRSTTNDEVRELIDADQRHRRAGRQVRRLAHRPAQRPQRAPGRTGQRAGRRRRGRRPRHHPPARRAAEGTQRARCRHPAGAPGHGRCAAARQRAAGQAPRAVRGPAHRARALARWAASSGATSATPGPPTWRGWRARRASCSTALDTALRAGASHGRAARACSARCCSRSLGNWAAERGAGAAGGAHPARSGDCGARCW